MRKLLSLALLLVAAWLVFTHERPDPLRKASIARAALPRAPTGTMVSTGNLTVRAAPAAEPELALPASLEGSEPPPLTFSPVGQVAIDLALRHFFDYFLSAVGELPDRELAALVQKALARRAREPSLGRALDVFDDYRRLSEAQRFERPARAGAADLEQLIAARRALRRRYLEAPVVEAFFAADEAREDYALARARAWTDTQDRKEVERISAGLLSPADRVERAQTFVLERLGWEREEGAEPGTWADLSSFDEGARARLADVEARQAEFARRRAAFVAARRARPGASEQELRALAQNLGLDEREFARVTAFPAP